MALIRRETPNRLAREKSPYLLQHAYNPVDWFPWGGEAFEKARRENKPVFLSIGYSTCHWCHVMARESFEDEAVAAVLNEWFVSVKVDREERPDVDNIYMRVCQTLTGGGGWPTSIFMTAEQKPFFAGTYFPKAHFLSLLNAIREKWAENPSALAQQGQRIAEVFQSSGRPPQPAPAAPIRAAVEALEQSFDAEFGGFGSAPKFPTPHILFLLLKTAPHMAEKTLLRMYRGGIFDHIGFGFSRYSTDRFWLVPHFEKMLYDNALLATAYLMAFESTGREIYRLVAEKTLLYLQRELESPGGGFFSAQDADSDGEEGKFYSFTPEELTALLGEADGRRFNRHFGITPSGNFEGRSIPNLLGGGEPDPAADALLPRVYEYRRARTALRTDRKILTAWNALALAAFANAHRILGERAYLDAALRTADFIERELAEGDVLFSGVTDGARGGPGLLDDYAFYIYALICLHQASQDDAYARRARELQRKALSDFFDWEGGGFFFSGAGNEKLLFNPKETYDGATPSGNSVMAYNLTRLRVLADAEEFSPALEKQTAFMNAASAGYPSGNGFYLYSMLPAKEIVCALKDRSELDKIKIKSDWIFKAADDGSRPLLNGKTTYYVCGEGACLPPSNQLPE